MEPCGALPEKCYLFTYLFIYHWNWIFTFPHVWDVPQVSVSLKILATGLSSFPAWFNKHSIG
jgi:hypothetical protein